MTNAPITLSVNASIIFYDISIKRECSIESSGKKENSLISGAFDSSPSQCRNEKSIKNNNLFEIDVAFTEIKSF